MWTEFFRVPSTSAVHLIRALRLFMARNGIPRVLTADQGAAYTSLEFKQFCEKMAIQGRVGSAKYSQGNAHAEAAVKRVKKWLRRCENEDDLFLAILAWHQTPLAQGRPSPAEIHLGRNVRDGLSWRVEQAKVDWQDVRLWKEAKNAKAKSFYDRGAREMSSLEPQQKVWVWSNGEKQWKSGVILEKLARPRSYLVRMSDGSELERNRRDLKPDNTWHSKNFGVLNFVSTQDCAAGLAPDGERDRRTRVAPVRGRGGGGIDHGGPGGGVADVVGGRATAAGDEQREQRPRSPQREPLHGIRAAAAVSPQRVSRSPRRSPEVRPQQQQEDPIDDEPRHDPDQPLSEDGVEPRPRRVKKQPVKMKDYVLY